MEKKRVLTGDRPTGKLHLGHWVGSLKNRVRLQDGYQCFIIVADLHALTTEYDHPATIKESVRELVLDYLSAGIDPKRSTIYLQSLVPEVTELFAIFSMLTTVNRLQRIPTLKDTMRDLRLRRASLGLLAYPVLQAADILMVRANLVPVGDDQASHLELTREIARRFNSLYLPVFPLPRMLSSEVPLLPGIDGKAKMSKSLDNAIYLSESAAMVTEKVRRMYTDPARIHPTDPGHVEGNPVFIYLDAFDTDKDEVADLKQLYVKGKVGDVEVKRRLAEVLNDFLEPLRQARQKFAVQSNLVDDILIEGSKVARAEAQKTLAVAREAMNLPYEIQK